MVTKTVNGFIAFGPIPVGRGAASCRPPRSWPLGRRSGRVPALPYPPPRLLQCIGDDGQRAMPGLGQPRTTGQKRPEAEVKPDREARDDDAIIAEDQARRGRGEAAVHVVVVPEHRRAVILAARRAETRVVAGGLRLERADVAGTFDDREILLERDAEPVVRGPAVRL